MATLIINYFKDLIIRKALILFYPLIFFIISYNIYALDIEVTSISAETYLSGAVNRDFDLKEDFSLAGELELNNVFDIRGGISYGRLAGGADLKSFASMTISPYIFIPSVNFPESVDFSFLWIYNGIFEFDVHSNSVIPVLTYNWRRVGLSFGYNFRITSFFGEDIIMEHAPVFLLYINFINNDALRLSLAWGNYNEFIARNFIDYSYNFILNIRLTDNMQLISETDFLQRGAFSFVESLYNISFRTGVRYTW